MKHSSLSGFTPNPAGQDGLWCNRMGRVRGNPGLGAAPYSAAGTVGLPRYNTGTTPVVGSPAPHMRVGRSPSPARLASPSPPR